MKTFPVVILTLIISLGLGVLIGTFVEHEAALRAARPKPAVEMPKARFVRESFDMIGKDCQRWVEVLRDTETGQHYVAYVVYPTSGGTAASIIPLTSKP
jgi:hypothetical protein